VHAGGPDGLPPCCGPPPALIYSITNYGIAKARSSTDDTLGHVVAGTITGVLFRVPCTLLPPPPNLIAVADCVHACAPFDLALCAQLVQGPRHLGESRVWASRRPSLWVAPCCKRTRRPRCWTRFRRSTTAKSNPLLLFAFLPLSKPCPLVAKLTSWLSRFVPFQPPLGVGQEGGGACVGRGSRIDSRQRLRWCAPSTCWP
jgi:hypothetical protein